MKLQCREQDHRRMDEEAIKMVILQRLFGLVLVVLPLSCVQVAWGSKCPIITPCGEAGNLSFPFTTASRPECGLLVIHGCEDDPGSKKSISNNNVWYQVVSVDQSTMTIRDDVLLRLLSRGPCQVLGYQTPFAINSPFAVSSVMYSAMMLKCNHAINPTPSVDLLSNYSVCGNNETTSPVFYYGLKQDMSAYVLNTSTYGHLYGCSIVQVPLGGPVDSKDPLDLLANFSLTADIPIQVSSSSQCYDCHTGYGGQCQLDVQANFFCDRGKTSKKIVEIAAASAAWVFGILMVLAWFFRRRFYNRNNPTYQIIEMFLKNHGHLAAKRYSYLEVKKATNSFKNKLGQGGYGSVYKGKLPDGTLVAVKVLSKSNGNGEEFINEVASISMTSHVNIVQLLGFCLDGSKRALLYKYMPNGSVEKFIYENKDPLKFTPRLTCKTMYKIAIGVARGLDYLHKGCNSRIVHFDIKPHNILLDEDFCPKISDFGLAKICTRKESIMSSMVARGTIGYIAPEVFSRNFGGVSHKSDVYSYGMMVLEMIGGKNSVNIEDEVEVESSSEMYFPHWIYKRLEQNQELELRCIKNEMDKEMIQKMTIVSLWCIQTDPSNRPTMSKVVDMLESSLQFLQIPPKPYLSSPPVSPSGSSISSHSDSSKLL